MASFPSLAFLASFRWPFPIYLDLQALYRLLTAVTTFVQRKKKNPPTIRILHRLLFSCKAPVVGVFRSLTSFGCLSSLFVSKEAWPVIGLAHSDPRERFPPILYLSGSFRDVFRKCFALSHFKTPHWSLQRSCAGHSYCFDLATLAPSRCFPPVQARTRWLKTFRFQLLPPCHRVPSLPLALKTSSTTDLRATVRPTRPICLLRRGLR